MIRGCFPNRLKKIKECQPPHEQQVQEQSKEGTEDAYPPLHTDCANTLQTPNLQVHLKK